MEDDNKTIDEKLEEAQAELEAQDVNQEDEQDISEENEETETWQAQMMNTMQSINQSVLDLTSKITELIPPPQSQNQQQDEPLSLEQNITEQPQAPQVPQVPQEKQSRKRKLF